MKPSIALISLVLLAGCARAPEKLESPRLVIHTTIRDNTVHFTMNLVGGLRNENSDRAFLDYSAEVVFSEKGKRLPDSAFNPVRISVPAIFPFETVPVSVIASGGEKDVRPLLDMLEIAYDDVVKSGATEEIYVPDENIALESVSFRRENIHSILKGKAHEKN
ncbi:MAG: hypothetical protein KBA15_00705 [Spirochaetes bacterium]|jgi:hypothetical protein|nr:hypothetical protein [Spirochaetota bacterium]